MDRDHSSGTPSVSARLSMAFKLVFDSAFARQVDAGLKALKAQATPSKAPAKLPTPERGDTSGLFVLSALQREGRLVDFLQQDVGTFSDEDVGAAARVVHAGCVKVMKQYFAFEPAIKGEEGAGFTVPQGFDSQRIRLTGNVTGQPPFKGTIKHHGWVAKEVRLPVFSESLDPHIIAPAEVELP